ncbi:uncharacterized protein LOC117609992 [Osmia lignaria lignaria]|uniref:uncharacterized protein LOC117609992 n=1 Tax=Osmia lignaria lignaria TaxID=1437193 RepID=UPI00402BE339
MRIVCAAKNCKYSSINEDSRQIMFINFPNDATSKIWAQHCGRTDLLLKSNEELHLNYYICSHHIEDHYYISKIDPVIIDERAVPTLFGSDFVTEKDARNVFYTNEETEVTDSAVLSYCDTNVDVDQYHGIGIRFSNLCRICGEPSVDGIEIFATKGIELKLKEKINLHLPVTIDVKDVMPQKLCLNCCNKLDIAHSLIITSLRTDMKLKKFLNINEELNYDNRYNKIVQQCSLEIAEEMCPNEETQTTLIELSSNSMGDSSVNQEITGKLNHLEEIHTINNIEDKMQSELNSFIESHNKRNKEDECTNKTMQHYPKNGVINFNKISCIRCNNSFKSQEMFENHKIFCYVKETTVKEQKEINSNLNSRLRRDSNNVEINLECISKESCNTCHKNFPNEKRLIEHKLSYCTFFEEEQYKLSNKPNANEEQYGTDNDTCDTINITLIEDNKKCGHCDRIFNTKKELLSHITQCHKSRLLLKCIICDRSYEKWSSLDVHEATHRIDKPYLCDLCGKSFKHSNNLRGHKRTHLDDSKKKRHICEICGNAFRSRFHLGEHMNQHNGNKPYPCDKCGKAFYKRIQLRQHTLSHGLNKHICPICGTAFNRKGNMNTHLKRHNNGNGMYTCSVCTYRCKTMSELKLHRKKHTEQDIIDSIRKKCIDKTIWQCKSCNRIFSTRTVLLNHERTHKKEKMNIECNVCGKKLSSKNSLIYHKRSMHSTERPHMCHYCGGSFLSKEARLIHERIHTGERPYVCKVCNMEYKCSSNLNQHMKIHSGAKPYKCKHCSKCFTRKGALSVHERVHTGEKPFSCDTCGRTFSQKNDMLKHTKAHQSKSLHCEQCNETFTRKNDILKHVTLHEQNNSMIEEYAEVQKQVESYNIDIHCSQFQ